MAPQTLDPPSEARPPRVETARGGRRRRHTAQRARTRLAYWLIAPAVTFMVLIHLVPTAAGFALSFKKLNIFTFSQLFGAPWNGLDNYRSILFDAGNPLHDGF